MLNASSVQTTLEQHWDCSSYVLFISHPFLEMLARVILLVQVLGKTQVLFSKFRKMICSVLGYWADFAEHLGHRTQLFFSSSYSEPSDCKAGPWYPVIQYTGCISNISPCISNSGVWFWQAKAAYLNPTIIIKQTISIFTCLIPLPFHWMQLWEGVILLDLKLLKVNKNCRFQ